MFHCVRKSAPFVINQITIKPSDMSGFESQWVLMDTWWLDLDIHRLKWLELELNQLLETLEHCSEHKLEEHPNDFNGKVHGRMDAIWKRNTFFR